MSVGDVSIRAEVWAIKAKKWLKMLLAALGFAAIGWAVYGMYEVHSSGEGQWVASQTHASYQQVFISQIETQLAVIAVGILLVFLASR